MHVTLKIQLYLAGLCDLVSYAVQKSILKTTKRKWSRGSRQAGTQGPEKLWNEKR